MSEIKADLKREEMEMDELVQEMMGYFCDELCRHPRYGLSQEELDQACAQCRMGEFRQRILDEYNRLSAHLLKELSKERQKHRWVPVSERLPKGMQEAGSAVLAPAT